MPNLKILKAIWGTQEGYVFVPRRRWVRDDDGNIVMDGKGKPKDEWDEGRAFKYPAEMGAVEARLTKSEAEWDTYWCPLVFSFSQRLKMHALPEASILWADLDFVNPNELDVNLRPTIAWKSSDERYQGLWVLDGDYDVENIEKVNKNLSYKIGADKGGWDVTQVLRVPGSLNHKYNPPQKGKMLWADRRVVQLDDVARLVAGAAETESEITLESIDDIMGVLKGYKIPTRTTDLLNASEAEVEVGDRSDRLWEIETSLIESGVPVRTVVQVIQACVWNKFRGRKDELNQIYNEVLKADEHVRKRDFGTPEADLDDDSEEDDDPNWAVPFGQFMSTSLGAPEWLVEGIWQAGTYGIIAGEPKTYKSVQATDLALSVASGVPFLNHFPVKKTGTVLMVQEENNPQVVQDRLYKIAASKGLLAATSAGFALPEDLPLVLSNNCGVNLLTPESRKRIEKTIRRVNPIMVILDPLYMMIGNADENSSKEVGDVLRWLTYLRNQYGIAIVLCHHYKKPDKDSGKSRGGTRIRGSSVFHGWVESALYINTTQELFTVKLDREFRAFPMMDEVTVKIEMGNPGHMKYKPQIITSSTSLGEMAYEETKAEEILTIVATGRRTFDEIKTLGKVSRPKLEGILNSLEQSGTIQRIPGGGRGKPTTYAMVEQTLEAGEEVDVLE